MRRPFELKSPNTRVQCCPWMDQELMSILLPTLEYRRTYLPIFLKLIELPLKLLELKEMWKITINLSPWPCLSHSLHWFANPSVHDIQALSDVNINNSWRNGLPPPWPHVRIPWGPWNPYTQATLRTGEVRVQASVFFRLPDDSSVQPNLKTSVLVGSLCFSGSYISPLFYNIKK